MLVIISKKKVVFCVILLVFISTQKIWYWRIQSITMFKIHSLIIRCGTIHRVKIYIANTFFYQKFIMSEVLVRKK